jgi:hypothetical protein
MLMRGCERVILANGGQPITLGGKSGYRSRLQTPAAQRRFCALGDRYYRRRLDERRKAAQTGRQTTAECEGRNSTQRLQRSGAASHWFSEYKTGPALVARIQSVRGGCGHPVKAGGAGDRALEMISIACSHADLRTLPSRGRRCVRCLEAVKDVLFRRNH